MIFVDTSAWYAAYVPSDSKNRVVVASLHDSNEVVVTTNFVIDETITLLQCRGERHRALNFGRDLLVNKIARIEHVSVADFYNAYSTFVKYSDKAWSFTDCTSYVLMQRLAITKDVTLDHHFVQMPGIQVVDLGM